MPDDCVGALQLRTLEAFPEGWRLVGDCGMGNLITIVQRHLSIRVEKWFGSVLYLMFALFHIVHLVASYSYL